MNIKIIILTLLVIAGIIAIALTWNFSKPEPKEIIEEMQTKMAELNTIHSKTVMNISAEVEGKEILTIAIAHDQDIDNTDTENTKAAGSFDVNIELEMEGMEDVSLSLKTENIIIKNTSYIKLAAIPSEPATELFFRMLGISFSGFLDQWIEFDQDGIDTMIKKDWPPQMDIDSELTKWQQPKTVNQFQEFLVSGDLSSMKQVLAEEKINNEPTYHYALSLEEKEEKEFTSIMNKYLNEIFPFLKDEIDQTTGADIDLWIGKKDKLLYKVELNKEIEIDEGERITLNMVLEFSDFDQPLNIIQPEQFKTLDELFSKNAAGYESDGYLIANDHTIMIDMNMILIEAQTIGIVNNSYNKVSCTDDLNMKMLCDDIEILSINQKKPTIHQSKNAFCSYIELSDGYCCIDNTLLTSKITTYPGQYGYCDGATFVCPEK